MSGRPEEGWKSLALVHSSWAHENGGRDNERLEFLGDAILGELVSQALFLHFPDAPEGELSRIRARLVSTEQLANLSRQMELDAQALLGKGEETTGGRQRNRLLAGLFEAWLAAIFLEEGRAAAEALVQDRLVPLFENARASRNAKQLIQEWAQKKHGVPPDYELVETDGPDHARRFRVQICIGTEVLGVAWGSSKRHASLEAARLATQKLGLA